MSGVILRRFSAPPVDRREILRYAGARGDAPELMPLLEECLSLMEGDLTYRVAFCEIDPSELPLWESRDLSDRLLGCERAVILAATVGLAPDRGLLRYGSREPLRGLLCQAIGAERIEALCDCFCEELRREAAGKGLFTLLRFSPGYGNLPLGIQRDIFRLLDCPGKIGLTLSESLLMSPSKSVTAFVGIRNCAAPAHSGGCDRCSKADCPFRRSL